MNLYLRLLGGCALVAAALVGLVCLPASALLGEGVFAPLAECVRHAEEGDRLSRLSAAAGERVGLKAAAAADLARGRLPLAEAVDRLRARYREEDYLRVPGRSPDERVGLALICWVAHDLEDDPGREPLLARLVEDLRAHLAAQGLPPPDPEGPAWVRRCLPPDVPAPRRCGQMPAPPLSSISTSSGRR